MKRSELWGPPPEGIELEFHGTSPPFTAEYKRIVTTAEMLKELHPWLRARVEEVHLPESIEEIDKMPPDRKKYTFPWVMPPIDFLSARVGEGPTPYHAYSRKYTDLRFVGNEGSKGWGFLTYDPTIKTPKDLIGKTIAHTGGGGTPSVLCEAILRDAWGILDQVEVITSGPPAFGEDLKTGKADAIFFGCAWKDKDGNWNTDPFPTRPILMEKQTYWLGISKLDAEKVSQKNPFELGVFPLPKGVLGPPGAPMVNPPEDVSLPLWTQFMVAWDTTEEVVVYELLKFMVENADAWSEKTALPMGLEVLSDFPLGVTKEMFHPGALRYYEEKGVPMP